MNNDRLNEIGGTILDAAITVHRELGRDFWSQPTE